MLTSVVTFRQAERAQQRSAGLELQEEVRDFAAGIQAGRNDGLWPREAIDSYTEAWPPEDRDTIVVAVGSDPLRTAGPLADAPELHALAVPVDSPQLRSMDVDGQAVRVLVTPLLYDGRTLGVTVLARLTQSDQDALRDRRIAVLAVALPWTSPGWALDGGADDDADL